MKKAKQQVFHEELLNMDQIKRDLSSDINAAALHSNEDSAKKRAVLQHMDYENFRQMVLGANLFPLKSGATANIIQTQAVTTRDNFNSTAAYQAIVRRDKGAGVGFNEAVVRSTLQMTEQDKFEEPKTPLEVERQLVKKCADSMQRYIYLRMISFEHFCGIFEGREVDTELLLVLCRTFKEQVTENAAFNNAMEQEFVCQFLTMLARTTQSFDFVLEFLGAEEQNLIKELISALTLVDTRDLQTLFKL